MKKFTPVAVIASLIAAVVVYAQPTPVISFGPVITVFNTTSAGAVNGSTYALPGGNANVLVWQLVPVGGPSAISASLQVSLDGTNWQTLSTCTTTTGCIYNAGVNAYVFVRTIQTSRTGGTSTTASINTTRAYGISSGSSPVQSGNLLFNPDNTYDIGAAAANRPRNVYAGTSVIAPGFLNSATGYFAFTGRSTIRSSADGILTLYNNAENGFTRLNLGGDTASFPGIRRNGAQVLFQLADGSGNADIIGNNIQTGASGAFLAATTFAVLGTPIDGNMRYCSDCTFANPCAGGGTGAIAKRLAGAWRCD